MMPTAMAAAVAEALVGTGAPATHYCTTTTSMSSSTTKRKRGGASASSSSSSSAAAGPGLASALGRLRVGDLRLELRAHGLPDQARPAL